MLTSSLNLDELSQRSGVPFLDVMFIAANAFGARSSLPHPRARMQLRPRGEHEVWQVILPLDSDESPFILDDTGLWLNGELIAELAGIENDDVVLTYLRAGGRSLTLNTNSRSLCTGCLFCPNVIEDAADATLDGVEQLSSLLEWVISDFAWDDLSGVEVITVCSGCFHSPDAAIHHFADLRTAADRFDFRGRFHLLSSVVRRREDLEALADATGAFHLTLTLECLTRRNLLLKDTKASLTVEESCRILDDCAELDVLGDFTYVAGLDSSDEAVRGLTTLIEHCTTFPRIQVFQAHNDYMRRALNPEARDISYFLDLRRALEPVLVERGLSPISWENVVCQNACCR